MEAFWNAFFMQAGYNTAIVSIGAALLGAGAGAIGVFVLLRKRALVSDAISHATLPGVAIAFLVGTYVLGDGRSLPLLLLGAATSAAIGVLSVEWIKNNTRLTEDASIGTVLSTFFALGIVLLTIIQALPTGGQAGMESFLLGATAGLLKSEAMLIVVASCVVFIVILALMKEFGLVCFDPDYASARGWSAQKIDLAMLGLLLAVVVIGLKTVGLILIIALAIIPPVAARFWTDRLAPMVLISSGLGAAGSYTGAIISSIAPNLPTGGVIVLVLFSLFLVSLIGSPHRGLLAAFIRHRRFQRIVHERQGLLAMARGEPIFDTMTRWVLRRARYVRRDGTPTLEGRGAAAKMVRDQALWNRYKLEYPEEALVMNDWSLRPIEDALPADLIDMLEKNMTPQEHAL